MHGFAYDKSSLRKVLNDMSSNDGDEYYTLDLDKLKKDYNVTLNYGSGYSTTPTMDRYVINEETHVIYYLKGVYFDGELYHTVGANPPIV